MAVGLMLLCLILNRFGMILEAAFFMGVLTKKSNHLYGENLRLSQFLPMMERYFDRWVFSKTARLFYFVESIGIDHVG